MFEWSKFVGHQVEATAGDSFVSGVVVDHFGLVEVSSTAHVYLGDGWDVKILVPLLLGAVIRFDDGQYAVRSSQDSRFPWIALDETGEFFADGDVRHMNFTVMFAGVDDA
jgi:hypothetical protein